MLLLIIENLLNFHDEQHSLIFRIIASFFISLVISFLLVPRLIVWFRKIEITQIIRENGPASHFIKRGTPTMGGIIIVISITLSILLCCCLKNVYVWYVLFVLFSYGLMGFIDDYRKFLKKDTLGLSVFWKYFGQSLIALVVIITMFVLNHNVIDTRLIIPFFKELMPKLGIEYILLAYFVIVGASNAVNLADGLDGLVIIPIVFISIGMALAAFFSGDINCASYLHVLYVQYATELVVICAAIIGACLGFLWFNAYPAQIFMGDTGSLALGGVLGLVSVILRQELLLLIMAGVFVMETISVILQVVYFKLWNKRIFLMAPIHHHFELKGLPESRIVIRFWIISFLLFLLGLISLKVR
ncbi:phospho-N-acetylmuramoyl-pentapeptide-transferase [Blochmannia endosymbiont of Camponotus (Colobopsis) obliquus]|uniref:phospho-N-acetylmuramoyl-pentapeptide- transferase n=1 Tax=Blochmannia endosymbiont of Camponotus (Colobopsis) obliquus TaxID=1505597 RepID=UPI00061ABEA3|nr:phospho-N-acetylmuramoyl-pentapeptide-transferase [Blochmannia endosymbiont of Camponotus (Colobopsis) obliquus]